MPLVQRFVTDRMDISTDSVESSKKVLLFKGFFERGDDKNKVTAEKFLKINFSQRDSIVLFDFASQFCLKRIIATGL